MLKFFRYAFARICLAASVGCLALRLLNISDEWCYRVSKFTEFIVTIDGGRFSLELYSASVSTPMNCRPGGIPLLFVTAIGLVAGVALLPVTRRVLQTVAVLAVMIAGLGML